MAEILLHHVAVTTHDLERSVAFYQRLFDLERLQRPAFATKGAWLAAGPSLQLHIVEYPDGTYRTRGVDINDVHFSFRTADFDAAVARLRAEGFSEELPEGDQHRMTVFTSTRAGFPQVYFLDPDWNMVEVNGAPDGQPGTYEEA